MLATLFLVFGAVRLCIVAATGGARSLRTRQPTEQDATSALSEFQGPFTDMGIQEHSDLGVHVRSTAETCAKLCLETRREWNDDRAAVKVHNQCRGFTFSHQSGACWLTPVSRDAAGSSYREWAGHDHYEMIASRGGDADMTGIYVLMGCLVSASVIVVGVLVYLVRKQYIEAVREDEGKCIGVAEFIVPNRHAGQHHVTAYGF
eukprot:gb/GFBE01055589.1/.p1 GENE.gb/GFBE01055589.1/~~gb/GFBE01055589.1/.p1  ORF type:complete len:204 (+),score=24.36 gb/GFBE01055589.1/:1-612(+)